MTAFTGAGDLAPQDNQVGDVELATPGHSRWQLNGDTPRAFFAS